MKEIEENGSFSKNCMVSIVYTTYNHVNYVSMALESFIRQKTNFQYEIIVHDDASTDNTQKIITEYESRYPELFVTIFQRENQWSKQVKHMWADFTFPKACGKYIALCDGDDYWIDPYKLQKQFDLMEENPESIFCFHNALKIYENSIISPKLFNSLEEPKIHDYRSLVMRDWYIATSTLFIKNVMYDFPAWFRNVGGNNDYALELLMALKGPFIYIQDIMSVYRILPSSVSVEYRNNQLFLFDSLINLYQNVKEQYPVDKREIFEIRINQLEEKRRLTKRYLDYPVLKLLNAKTYKRIIGRMLHFLYRAATETKNINYY
jgi:glycosyltransferase involved in cell wall biosynthesis